MNVSSKLVKKRKNVYLTYHNERGDEFYYIILSNIRTQQEADLQVDHMSLKNWFTPKLKQQLIIAIKDYTGFEVND